jgi:hypothetical protein
MGEPLIQNETMKLKAARWVLILMGLTFWPAYANAHGIWGHVHVTGWAIENLPEGELRDFFAEPEVFNAAVFGAAFTDSGYWPQIGELAEKSRVYSEHTHWEPFIEDYIKWMKTHDPPPWDSLESRKRVAFLMGCGSHGLQDEIFDSLFLFQVEEQDQGNQDNADPASDGFLADQGLIRFFPTSYIPYDLLLELYANLEQEITEDTIQTSVKTMTTVYLNDGVGQTLTAALAEEHSDDLPWMKAHFLDPSIPGSLRSEILPTGGYMQAIWDRLHDRFDPNDVVVFRFPEAPYRLHSGDPNTVNSVVTLIYGAAVHQENVSVQWTHEEQPVAHDLSGTRWGGTYSRLQRLAPKESLAPGSHHRIEIDPGLELIDGRVSSETRWFSFQVECSPDDSALCPDLSDTPAPSMNNAGPFEVHAPPVETLEDSPKPEVSGGGCNQSNAPQRTLPLLALSLVLFLRRHPKLYL